MQIEVIGPRTGKYSGALLSAAPVMLAALQSVARLLDDPDADHFDADRVQAEVLAAIKLATGGAS